MELRKADSVSRSICRNHFCPIGCRRKEAGCAGIDRFPWQGKEIRSGVWNPCSGYPVKRLYCRFPKKENGLHGKENSSRCRHKGRRK